MAHTLIVGMTESGKTTLAVKLAKQYREQGIKVLVLDPLLDPRWPADFLTDDRHYFLEMVKHPDTFRCAVFVDESAEMIGQYKDEMFFLATRSRHYGHNCHFITQRGKQLAKTVRDQCSFLGLFNCSFDDVRDFANEFNRPELREANTLKRGEYFWCGRFGKLERYNVFTED